MQTLRYVRVLLVTASALFVGTSCNCERAERPYTPFGVASNRAPAPGSASTAQAPSTAPLPTRERAATVKPPLPRVEVDGLELVAPDGLLVARTLVFTPGESVLGWLVPAGQKDHPGTGPGVLHLFQKERAPRELATLPGFVPTLPGCRHEVELTRTGPRTVTLDIAAGCENVRLPERTPTRSIEVIFPERERPVLLSLRLAPALPEESVRVEVDTADLDQDGHDDVTATFELATREGVPTAARVQWLNRAAGVSREFSEPRKSFEDTSSVEWVRAKGKGTSVDVPERVQNVRRLISYLCEESGSPRVTDDRGRGVECGDLELARDRLAQAEIRALLTAERFGEALLALELSDWYGSLSDGGREQAIAGIRAALPARSASVTHLSVRPRDPGPSALFSSLAFGADDQLLIQSADGLWRASNGNLVDASEELDPWPLTASGPHGESWVGLVLPCEKALVELQVRQPDGSFTSLLEGRWLSPRPSVCTGKDPPLPQVRPVRWDERGLGVLVGPVWLGSDHALASPNLGAPVSANGKNWVSVTPLGVFVQHETSAELWKTPADVALRNCVVRNDGKAVACTGKKDVVVLSAEPSASPSTVPASP